MWEITSTGSSELILNFQGFCRLFLFHCIHMLHPICCVFPYFNLSSFPCPGSITRRCSVTFHKDFWNVSLLFFNFSLTCKLICLFFLAGITDTVSAHFLICVWISLCQLWLNTFTFCWALRFIVNKEPFFALTIVLLGKMSRIFVCPSWLNFLK